MVFQDAFNLRERCEDRRHPAVIGHRDARHLAAAGADGFEGVCKRQGADGDQRSVFAEAVAHGHIGLDAVGVQQARQGQIGREHRRLGDGRLQQIRFGRCQRARIRRIHENVFAQGFGEQGRHRPVGFLERACHDRLDRAQRAHHVHVLRSLAGVEKGHLGGGAAAAEDALRAQRLPRCWLIRCEGFERFPAFIRQLGGIAEVDGDALRRAQVRFGRREGALWARRCPARLRGLLGGVKTLGQFSHGGGAGHQHPAQRRLRGCRAGT